MRNQVGWKIVRKTWHSGSSLDNRFIHNSFCFYSGNKSCRWRRFWTSLWTLKAKKKWDTSQITRSYNNRLINFDGSTQNSAVSLRITLWSQKLFLLILFNFLKDSISKTSSFRNIQGFPHFFYYILCSFKLNSVKDLNWMIIFYI